MLLGLLLLALVGGPAWAQDEGRAVKADTPAAPEPVARSGRVALVVGNDRYEHTQPLAAAVHDAELVADTLADAGFEVVLLRNATLRELELGLAELRVALSGAEVGLVYYAGHGVQIDGRNYLVPVDADLTRPEYVAALTLEVQDDLIAPMAAAGAPLNLVVLDACRNNPFARSWVSTGRALDTPGLTTVQAAPGFVIAYATSPGAVALDGREDPREGLVHGPYAEALAAEMREEGQELQQTLQGVYDRVFQSTGGQQIPWSSQSLGSVRFYFTATEGQQGLISDGQAPEPVVTEPADPGWRPTAGLLPGAVPLNPGSWTVSAQAGVAQLDGQSGDGWAALLAGAQVAWAPRTWLHLGAALSGGGITSGGKGALYTGVWARARLLEREHLRLAGGLSVYAVRGEAPDDERLATALVGPFFGLDVGGERLRWDLTLQTPVWSTSLLAGLNAGGAWPPDSLLAGALFLETGLRLRFTDTLTARVGSFGCTVCVGASGRYDAGRWALNADFGRIGLVDGFYGRVGAERVF